MSAFSATVWNVAMDTVYVETSIISHATAWPSSDPATAVLQEQAKRWMNEQRPLYDVVTSQLVIDEASMGDPDAAARRLQMLDRIPVLPVNPDADTVADEIVSRSLMPASARIDALHLAIAALAGVQYLLTQNCKHIANAANSLASTGCSMSLAFLVCWSARQSNSLGGMRMTRNPILDELHAARRQILAEYNGDTAAYLRDAQARLEASGRPIAHRKQRTIRCTGAAKPSGVGMDNQSSPPADR